jgi:uncharacterized protein (DUF2126 family)
MGIKVSLNHRLSYQFERAIILGPHTLGLRPSPHCRTAIHSYALKIDPRDHHIIWQQDHYGNFLARLNFPTPSDRLHIEVDLIAQLQPINPFNFLIEAYAEHYPFTYDPQLRKELQPFLEVTESGTALTTWMEQHRQADLYTIDFLVSLNQQLAEAITHLIRLEAGIQSCEATLTQQSGACRDTAWLLVQLLRHYGLAARFVSGYLIQLQADIPPLDGPAGPEVDHGDLHAWAEVYLPGAGWIGLDPTSGLLAAEGHIPLVCTAEPAAASPVIGTTEPCQSQLEFSVTVSRFQEVPRASKPYTESQWQQIDALGQVVETQLQSLGVGLTMGGEPTFVSIDDFESLQWQVEALGTEKRALAGQLLQRLAQRFARGGGLLHYGLGKSYATEAIPRWALGCYWRKDGVPLWRNPQLRAADDQDYGHTLDTAQGFMQTLVNALGVDSGCIIPTDEPETQKRAGYLLPLVAVRKDGRLRWSTCHWTGFENQTPLILLMGTLPIGLRLPLAEIPLAESLETEANATLEAEPTATDLEPLISPPNSIRVALSVEVRQGVLHVFLPPIASARSFVDLVTAIEDTAGQLGTPVRIEGYTPPGNAGIEGFQITPDPGVIEVNIHPAATWDELVQITTLLYDEARLCRLGTEKYRRDGRRISTGGGAHITIGGTTTLASPLLRRPDLLGSLIRYWQNHPSLSYLFAGLFVGPTSQSPRVDEARHESLYELEIALQALQPGQDAPTSLVDRLLRNLLIDVTGNTHRAELCIDKLYPVENPKSQFGLLEFRAFAMPPHVQMRLLQMLLIRALVAWFWEYPYQNGLIRWGTTLHDRFMLPHYLGEDLKGVLADLQKAGYDFEFDWFASFFEFRFPRYGEITVDTPAGTLLQLELRDAIEPWPVLGEEVNSGRTARYVDDSMERLQVMLRGAWGNSHNLDTLLDRYAVTCNGQRVPLKSTGVPGEYVGGVRFRARQLSAMLYPMMHPHSPLVFDVIDTRVERSIGGCTYYVTAPNGAPYDTFPLNAREAESRLRDRFVPQGHTPGIIKLPSLQLNPEYPLTLDLRVSPKRQQIIG